MNGKIIVFDFDGTIADTYHAIVEITNQLSSEFGYKPIDEEERLLLKNLSSREIVKQSEISIFKIPFLVKRVQKELGKEIANLEPIPGIKPIISQLATLGYGLGIITSNTKENVLAFLVKQQLDTLFDFIYSGTSIFGKHRIINQVIRQNNLRADQIIYVGDETRDIISARKSKVGMIAVTWGFNSAKILAEYQPNFLVATPEELIDAIASQENFPQQNHPEKIQPPIPSRSLEF